MEQYNQEICFMHNNWINATSWNKKINLCRGQEMFCRSLAFQVQEQSGAYRPVPGKNARHKQAVSLEHSFYWDQPLPWKFWSCLDSLKFKNPLANPTLNQNQNIETITVEKKGSILNYHTHLCFLLVGFWMKVMIDVIITWQA